MRPFTYQAPTSIKEAVDLLADKGSRARPYAGGTDLLVQIRRGLHDIDTVVDVKHIPELSRISFDPITGLAVGAAVSCADIRTHPQVIALYPGLVDAVSIIGGTAIQERATMGGNLCNAAPSGDAIPAMIVHDATCVIAGPKDTRTVPVASFCTAPGKTVLTDEELLVSIHFSPPLPGSGASYRRFTPRHEMDIAVAGAGAWVQLTDGKIAAARIAIGAVAPTPLLVEEAGSWLANREPTADTLTQAAAIAQQAALPITDVRGTEAQRRHLVGVLVRRTLQQAVERAKGKTQHG
jgi:CO/xanthine dehydrogenase FAD-binding subunit